ncbi:hypothetical protein MGH68_08560 [Erysipelothrix sp. D19-032]
MKKISGLFLSLLIAMSLISPNMTIAISQQQKNLLIFQQSIRRDMKY